MKKKVILVVAFFVICVMGVFLYHGIKIHTLDFSLLNIYLFEDAYHPEGYRTELTDFPSFESRKLSVDGQNALLCKNSDGSFFSVSRIAENNTLCKLDENFQVLESVQIDRQILMLYEYEGKPLMFCEEDDVTYRFVLYDFEKKQETLFADGIVLGEYATRVHSAHKLICAQNSDGDIFAGNLENGLEKTDISGDKFALLGIKDEKTVLVFELFNRFFSFGRIYEYDVETGDMKHLRFARIQSNNYCTVSPDGKYLVSHEIIRPDNICSPVVYDLSFPVSAKYRDTDKGYSFIQWIYN